VVLRSWYSVGMGDPQEIKRYDRSTEAEIDLSPSVITERVRRLFLLRDMARYVKLKNPQERTDEKRG
jgi:hypothetical protein